ncbi:endo-1,4-beta-xylanase [bacterium]|nr:endo-1,4-beta-xylanase [bacterium]
MDTNTPRYSSTFSKTVLLCAFWLFTVSCSQDRAPEPTTESVTEDPVENPTPLAVGLKDFNPEIKIGGNFSFVDQAKYLAITETEFNATQVLYYAGFGGWPSRNEYDFTNLNTSVNWLAERNIGTHIHMLFGPDLYMPDWLKKVTWTPEELDSLMQEYIQNIMDANDNKNKVAVWNVINELFNDDGTYRSDMVWNQMGFEDDISDLTGDENINTQHPIFIRKAFEYCRNATSAKLEYRDYLIENNDPGSGWDKKHKATYQLLKHMLNSNIPLDAVGIQGHFDIGELGWVLDNKGLQQIVEKFKALGLEVYITEMDIGTKGAYTTAEQEQQRTDFYNYTLQALNGGAERIYTWGVHDGRDQFWRTDEKPLLWDANLDPKKAYEGVKKALQDAD